MSFLSPISALIAAALTVPALVALYFLKLRRRQMPVPTTLLWQKAIQDMQVNTPFQRLRRNLLLLLQLLILAALLLAMARPTLWATASPGQRVIIIVDQSASMNAPAGDDETTRLDQAKEAARRMIDNLSASAKGPGGAMVVSFAHRPNVQANFTADPAKLRRAVDQIQPTDQLSRLDEALRLVQPYAQQAAAQNQGELMVHVITDGRVHQQKKALTSLNGAKLNFVQVAEQARPDNVAVVAASARRSFETPERVQLFARLANYGPAPVQTNLTLKVGPRISRVQQLDLPAGSMTTTEAGPALSDDAANNNGDNGDNERTFQPGTQSVQFDFVLPSQALVELSHNHADALKADDAAHLVLAPAKRLRVLLVTRGNAFLQRVINSIGVRQLVTMGPEQYQNQDPAMLRRGRGQRTGGPGSGFDVIIFDQYRPNQLPPVPTLSLGATPPIDNLTRKQPANDNDAPGQVILDWQRRHPLMRYVTLSEVVLADPSWLAVPPEATVLATAERGPVIAQLSAGGRRHVVSSFSVLDSNWPMQVSFPVFVSNALQQLGLGGLLDEAGVAYRTGQTAVVPVTESIEELRYGGPEVLSAPVADDQAVLGPFTRAGVYRTEAEVEPPHGQLAVNLLDTLESDLRPADQLEIAAQPVKGKQSGRAVEQQIWPWFLWGALALLMLEWLAYLHRMRV
jgi:hypothetical protein